MFLILFFLISLFCFCLLFAVKFCWIFVRTCHIFTLVIIVSQSRFGIKLTLVLFFIMKSYRLCYFRPHDKVVQIHVCSRKHQLVTKIYFDQCINIKVQKGWM
jgi:hypothetical protein